MRILVAVLAGPLLAACGATLPPPQPSELMAAESASLDRYCRSVAAHRASDAAYEWRAPELLNGIYVYTFNDCVAWTSRHPTAY